LFQEALLSGIISEDKRTAFPRFPQKGLSGGLRMMSIVRAFLLLLLLMIWPAMSTAALQFNDFAYGLRIAVPQKGAGATCITGDRLPSPCQGRWR
jgi:hypothetical protein